MTKERLSRYRVNRIRLKNTNLSIEERDRLEKENQIIDDFVNHINDKDVEIKQIIEWRYIKGRKKPSWQAIAMRLGCLSEHTPNRRLIKYLEQNKRE